jgi:hypothetical protein
MKIERNQKGTCVQGLPLPTPSGAIRNYPPEVCPISDLVHVPIVVAVSNVRAQTLDVLGHVGFDLAIAKVGESVRIAVSNFVVFETGLLDALEEMDRLPEKFIQLALSPYPRSGVPSDVVCLTLTEILCDVIMIQCSCRLAGLR